MTALTATDLTGTVLTATTPTATSLTVTSLVATLSHRSHGWILNRLCVFGELCTWMRQDS
jgi:hypothetical protein